MSEESKYSSDRDVIDEKLTHRLNTGDRHAFTEVYDVFAPDIFRHVRLRVRNVAEADEIAQQAFLQAWDHVASQAEEDVQSIRAFLYRVAQNLIIDWYRRQGRRPQAELTEAVYEQLGEDETLSAQVDVHLDMKRVRKALEVIREEYRDIVVWRFVDELSVEDIATLIDKTPNNVYVLTHRALNALRKALEGEAA